MCIGIRPIFWCLKSYLYSAWEQYNWRANSKVCRFFLSFSLILSIIPNEIWLSLIYNTNFSPNRFWIQTLIGNLIKHKKVFPWKNWILAWIWAIIRDLLSKESTSIKIHIIATADLPEFLIRRVWLVLEFFKSRSFMHSPKFLF